MRLKLSLLEWELELRSGSVGCDGGAGGGVVGAMAGAVSEEEEGLLVVVLGVVERFDLRQPPPTGTLRRTPPLVQ